MKLMIYCIWIYVWNSHSNRLPGPEHSVLSRRGRLRIPLGSSGPSRHDTILIVSCRVVPSGIWAYDKIARFVVFSTKCDIAIMLKSSATLFCTLLYTDDLRITEQTTPGQKRRNVAKSVTAQHRDSTSLYVCTRCRGGVEWKGAFHYEAVG